MIPLRVAKTTDRDPAVVSSASGNPPRRITSADFSRLAAIHEYLEQQAATNNVNRFFEANQRFHSALQEIAGNSYLAQLIDDARKVIKLTRRDSLRLEGRLKQSLTEHRAILEALRARIRVWRGNACTITCSPGERHWRGWLAQADKPSRGRGGNRRFSAHDHVVVKIACGETAVNLDVRRAIAQGTPIKLGI